MNKYFILTADMNVIAHEDHFPFAISDLEWEVSMGEKEVVAWAISSDGGVGEVVRAGACIALDVKGEWQVATRRFHPGMPKRYGYMTYSLGGSVHCSGWAKDDAAAIILDDVIQDAYRPQ